MIKYIKATVFSAIDIFKQLKLFVKVLILLVVGGTMFSTVAITLTGTPQFCNSCHIMNPYYDNWKSSTHSEVNCLNCHLQPGLAGYIKGKINGMAQAVDCVVGRIGTKPNATVEDASCLRPGCHSIEEIESKYISYNNIKFTHKGHVSKTIDGIKISCGTCHSHFEGDEHFGVNSQVCFSCHFLKAPHNADKIVKTSCRDCHEIPTKVIQQGLVKVNHAEFVSYKASCEDSCHIRQTIQPSEVADTVCLNCHSFTKELSQSSRQLHEIHTTSEKVECFACHGRVEHGPAKEMSVAAMMDCRTCHSDTHNIQRSVYTAQKHPQDKGDEQILGPMFLTHVQCADCHIENIQVETAGIVSIGTVAKAVPRACDNCHEPGTGQKYIPFWQNKIKQLYRKTEEKLNKLQQQVQFKTADQAKQLQQTVDRAKTLLDSVKADGSWGVHNLKYTEAMLLQANEIIVKMQQD
jgi:nitrate/TMAO reductase-like tetraheme cytochrome c subunit